MDRFDKEVMKLQNNMKDSYKELMGKDIDLKVNIGLGPYKGKEYFTIKTEFGCFGEVLVNDKSILDFDLFPMVGQPQEELKPFALDMIYSILIITGLKTLIEESKKRNF